jgi:AraC-like DNA-binding protein
MSGLLQPWFDALLDASAAFEVTLLGTAGRLRMRPGWEVKRGPLDEQLFYYVAEGGFDALWDGATHRIATGDLLWAERGTHIHFRLRENDSLLAWRFRLRATDAAGNALRSPTPFWHISPARSCMTWIEQIIDEASFSAPHHAERLRALLLCLLTEIARAETAKTQPTGVLSRGQRQRIERHCIEHQWASPADLARLTELSPDYFTRCFRRTYGEPPRQWLLGNRIKLAASRLLESNLNISQVAHELGYDDVFLFSRQFKAVFGESPTRYRQRHNGVEQTG